TADAPLTVMQTIPLSGVVAVFTPQDLTEMIVRKAVKMARKMDVPVLGLIENMSYLMLPETGEKLEVFGSSKGEDMAKSSQSVLLGRLPLDPQLARLCDEGNIETYDSDALSEIFAGVLSALGETK
ncbi:MAG: P-loop NTPase, partial [Dehalococcoidia bacterium]|nr:P-loop NTPase [Dehalococcoidia bacterium]